jgi:hypothetical protein
MVFANKRVRCININVGFANRCGVQIHRFRVSSLASDHEATFTP